MRLKIYYINFFVLFMFLLFSSCSTKKKTWVNRQYHNTTAKFNGYFNGTQSIKAGVKKLHLNHKDDYNLILPVFPTGELKNAKNIHSYMDKAIQKGSIVIQRHSMKIKGKEYCRWIDDNYLMVGKAYFYKGDFDEALKTFNFIRSEYDKNEIRFDAHIWLIRSYVEEKDFGSAERELEQIIKDKKLPKRLKKELTLVTADFYLQKKDYISAEKALLEATSLISNKRKKARLNYILAQIYQNSNNYLLAQKHYKTVLRSNPEYEMVFNSKMNLARTLEKGSAGTKKMKDKILKMTRDDKNKNYLDQIYYTIAKMDLNNNDTSAAIKNYKLSTIKSEDNNAQKALSFLALGELYFSKKLYRPANTNYDSTIFYMENSYINYENIKKQQEVLSELVFNLDIIELQDSLQTLANLPISEQKIIINTIIQEIIEKERQQAEEERLKKQMLYESNRNGGRGEQFGNTTSGGKWYFYNPATLSFGKTEFKKKWGKRKLEDNWRRKNKKTTNSFDSDTTSTDTLSVIQENIKDPNYYIKQLPKTKEDFEVSDNQIKNAYYQLGVIYKEALDEIDLSTSCFLSIFKRYPKDTINAPLSLYNVYLNHEEKNHPNKTKTKETLEAKYPNSIYTKMITNPSFKHEELNKKNKAENKYKEIYSLYKQPKYLDVILKTAKVEENKYKNKTLLLRAFSFIKTNKQAQAIATLERIPKDEEEPYVLAQNIIESLKDPAKMQKANELAITESSYLYRSNTQHMIILVLPKKEVDVTYLKTLISDFHAKKTGNEVFEISALLLGLDNHLLMIKTFKNIKQSMEYYDLFIKETTLMSRLNKSKHKIMSISTENFQEFYKNKDVEGYYNFFKNNYLDKD